MMNAKQKYDERKRLRIENELRAEQERKDRFERQDVMDDAILRLIAAFERLADVAELWADKQ